jgi:hypothetical protein
MSAAAVARAKALPLDRQSAVNFVNSLPYLVASSPHKLLQEMCGNKTKRHQPLPQSAIYTIEFPVTIGSRTYTFEAQPFRVIRQITKAEYLAVLPNGQPDRFYYEIHTD